MNRTLVKLSGSAGRWAFLLVFAVIGCDVPAPFELSPLDAGRESFPFPPEHLLARGSGNDRVVLTWSSRSTSLQEVRVERGTSPGELGAHVTLIGSSRQYQDLGLSPLYRYWYRLTNVGTNGPSRSATLNIEWQTRILFQLQELTLPPSGQIIDLVMNNVAPVGRLLAVQADGRVSVFSYDGDSYRNTSSAILSPRPTNAALSPLLDHVAVTGDSVLMILSPLLQVIHVLSAPATLRTPSFSSTGLRVLAGSSDGMLRMWETLNGVAVDSIFVPGGGILKCEYSQDGSTIGVLSVDGSIRFYRTIDHSLKGTSLLPGATGLSLDATGTLAAVTKSGAREVRVYQTNNGSSAGLFSGPMELRQAVFTPTGPELLMIGQIPSVRLVNVVLAKDLPIPDDFHPSYVAVAGGFFGRRFAFVRPDNVIVLRYAEPQWVGAKP